jgi:hypothetical protein
MSTFVGAYVRFSPVCDIASLLLFLGPGASHLRLLRLLVCKRRVYIESCHRYHCDRRQTWWFAHGEFRKRAFNLRTHVMFALNVKNTKKQQIYDQQGKSQDVLTKHDRRKRGSQDDRCCNTRSQAGPSNSVKPHRCCILGLDRMRSIRSSGPLNGNRIILSLARCVSWSHPLAQMMSKLARLQQF